MSHDNHDRDLKRPVYDRYDQISDWYLSARTDAEMEQPYLAKLASSMPANGHLLDIGCGSGRPIADYFIQRGHRVTGVDGSTHLIAAARRLRRAIGLGCKTPLT